MGNNTPSNVNTLTWVSSTSNHWPIKVILELEQFKRRPYLKYDQVWEIHSQFTEIVSDAKVSEARAIL